MRCIWGIFALAAFGLLAAGLSSAPASAGLTELINRTDHAAAPLRLANRNDPRCRKCDRELDKCDKHPPYGNERICASNYYDCIRRAHVKCD